MHPIEDVLQMVMSRAMPLEPEETPLDACLFRHAAEAVEVQHDAPPFDNSAMDGYAVRSSDLAQASSESPVYLSVVGEVRAGSQDPGPLKENTAIRIFTGAPTPTGADAVVIQERVTRDGDCVSFTSCPAPGANIRRRGENQSRGTPFLSVGDPLTPGALAWLASQDLPSIQTFRPPRVALISTGDELRDPGSANRPGSIVDSNRVALSQLVREAGAEPWCLPRCSDDPEAIQSALRRASTADLILTSGGASVGEYDFVRDALEALGGSVERWKVALKPGKPVMVGSLSQRLFIGLPGNPVSAMVTFEVFVRPALRKMLGDSAPYPSPIWAELATQYRRRADRVELARVTLIPRGDGWSAQLFPRLSSAALDSLVHHDGLAILPIGRDSFEPGDRVRVIPRGSTRGSSQPIWPITAPVT